MIDLKRTIIIWKKEMTDSLRDRRTLMAMIFIPMLMMPLLTIGMFKLMDKIMAEQKNQTAKIAIVGKNNSPAFSQIMQKQQGVEIVETQDAPGDVKSEKIDAAVLIPDNFENAIEDQKPASVELIIKSTNSKSSNASISVLAAVNDLNNQTLQARFTKQNVNPDILSRVEVKQNDVATEQEAGGFVLGLLVPMFIVMWAITGGQYTAIDVSAGEKERKTLEALLVTPASRIDIVLGKFLAVCTAALVSVIIAIGSFYLVLVYSGGFGPMAQNQTGQITPGGAGVPAVNFSIDPMAMIILFIVSIFLVLMFSAVILSISIFAKSFKEAQSYLGPSYLVVILPVVITNSIPGFKAADWLFAIPAVNAVLLFKEILMGNYDSLHIATTIGSLIIYAAISIVIAVRIYSQEGILFKD